MKRIEYTISSKKVNSDKNIAVISDMHISENTPNKKLVEILDTLDEIEPSHIVIPGDLYNVDLSTICSEKVTKFVNEASEIADVFYVKGDIEDKGAILNMRILPVGLEKRNNKKVHVLCENIDGYQEKIVKHDEINIAGLRLRNEFYELNENDKYVELLNKYKKYLERLSKQCGKENFNVLLCHDPIIRDILTSLEHNFDLVISSHNHGRMIPNFLRPLMELITDDIKKYYPSYTYEMMSCGDENYMIVSEGITKFHSEMGVLEHLEGFHKGTIENVRVRKK